MACTLTDSDPQNPEPEEIWSCRQSIGIVKELMNGKMHPSTLAGLERAMKLLAKQ